MSSMVATMFCHVVSSEVSQKGLQEMENYLNLVKIACCLAGVKFGLDYCIFFKLVGKCYWLSQSMFFMMTGKSYEEASRSSPAVSAGSH